VCGYGKLQDALRLIRDSILLTRGCKRLAPFADIATP